MRSKCFKKSCSLLIILKWKLLLFTPSFGTQISLIKKKKKKNPNSIQNLPPNSRAKTPHLFYIIAIHF